ncbi:MAG: hypothetical protein Q9184_008347 [Pyrenodesmia sp. 2 TL-2023]
MISSTQPTKMYTDLVRPLIIFSTGALFYHYLMKPQKDVVDMFKELKEDMKEVKADIKEIKSDNREQRKVTKLLKADVAVLKKRH